MKALAHFVRRKGPRGRRGTVLILALGVLAILSIAALSYVTVVRLERSNVAVAVRGADYKAKVDQVVDHVGDLLTADLFGNKIVTQDVQFEITGTTTRIWPGRFEDGDYRDALTFEMSTFNSSNVPAIPSPTSILQVSLGQRALPDDAFLAAIEPKWDRMNLPNSLLNTTTWPQITNLRSAYTYDENGTPGNPSDDRWVRGDGRFADLASWFYATTAFGYADPLKSLVDWNDSRVRQIGPDAGIADNNSNEFGITQPGADTDFFGFQMNRMSGSNPVTLGPPRPSDERQWVDTDGDLRPDARWTVLDQLNIVGGLTWVVAARIVDASALVNVNAAIEFGGVGPYVDITRLGDGRTPADIDLPRLLESMNRPTAGQPYANAVQTDRLFWQINAAYDAHLRNALGMQAVVDDSILNGNTTLTNLAPWMPSAPTTRAQRTEFWNLFGQNALRPSVVGRRGGGYPVRELMDLAAFHATNNAGIVSRVEQAFDGTEALGYLPNDTAIIYGPMRSKENAASIRRWIQDMEDFNTRALPTAIQIHDSARRFLTPTSGVGKQSPVPALNPALRTQLSVEKVNVSKAQSAEDTRNAFQALVWALAPLATDQPLNETARVALSGTAGGNGYAVQSENAHYGGYSGAESAPNYRSLARHLYNPGNLGIPNPLASFAVITSASMAANLADAIDTDIPAGGTTARVTPTTVSLYNTPTPPLTGVFGSIPLGTRLAQGDIPSASLPWIDTTGAAPLANPYLVVGLDRQPFLREVTTITVFSDYNGDRVGISTDYSTGTTPNEALGSAFIAVLTNPWSTPIQVGTDWHVVIPETVDESVVGGVQSIDDLGTPIQPLRMTLPASTIPAGSSKVFVWVLEPDTVTPDAWTSIAPTIRDTTSYGGNIQIVLNASISPLPNLTTNRIPFLDLCLTPQPRGALLTYTRLPGDANNPDLVVDRLRPRRLPTPENFPVIESVPYQFGPSLGSPVPDNLVAAGFQGGFDQSWFESPNGLNYPLGSMTADSRMTSSPAQITGRLMTTSTLSRPVVQPIVGGSTVRGFSAVVIEDRDKNLVKVRRDALAWLHPPVAAPIPDTMESNLVRDNPDLIVSPSATIAPTGFPANHVTFADLPTTPADAANPYGVGGVDLPQFQLFVPNSPLIASSDMLRLSTYAHTCRDCGNAALARDLTRWRTVSEKLGQSLNYYYGDTVTRVPNSYVGVLDPTRYVPDSDLASYQNVPSTLKLPLALRVPDCFEACPVTTSLVQGRINLNTAPLDVIGALPLVSPQGNIDDPVTLSTALGPNTLRRDAIEAYRQADRTIALTDALFNPMGLPDGMRPGVSTNSTTGGFATSAELAVLGYWERGPGGQMTGRPTLTQPGTFLQLGADGVRNDFSPLQLDEYVMAESGYGAQPHVNPIDDPEERLALYRAVSNIATARSDVYIAWFVIRGYDPQTIEQINMGTTIPNEEDVIREMDDAMNTFVPVHESRWLVVFDRSQTESGDPLDQPTERPRVLMKVQLPSAKP
jgi:hypothetical protein